MKNLDLNAYGVTEMSHQEMVETDGGIGIIAIAVISAIALVATIAIILGVETVKQNKIAAPSAEPLALEPGKDYYL